MIENNKCSLVRPAGFVVTLSQGFFDSFGCHRELEHTDHPFFLQILILKLQRVHSGFVFQDIDLGLSGKNVCVIGGHTLGSGPEGIFKWSCISI